METCPKCGELFVPIWEERAIKCDKCKSKISLKNYSKVEREKLEAWNKSDLLGLIDQLSSKISSIYEEKKELKNRVETLGVIVEQSS